MALSDSAQHQYLKRRRSDRLDSYRSTPEDINAHYREEGQIQSDYHKRFAYELIQNADDAMDDEGERKVRFELTDDALIVANTGRPIDEDDVQALCTMSATTKDVTDDKRATIGHKGRGFSSVLEITERPQIYSTGISFEFNRKKARREIEDSVADLEGVSQSDLEGIPLMRLPFSPPDAPNRVRQLMEEGHTTVFRFELKTDERERLRSDIADALGGLRKETVLFLQNLSVLEIGIRGDETHWRIDREVADVDVAQPPSFVEVRREMPSSSEESVVARYAHFTRSDIEIGNNTGGINENTWGDVEFTRVGIAFQVEEREDGIHLKRLSERPNVHVFLPTEEECPLPLLLNGAFHTAISRTRIAVTADADNYNGFLLRKAADILTDEVLDFVQSTATSIEEYIECLDFTHLSPEARKDDGRVEGQLIGAVRAALDGIEIVPQLEKRADGRSVASPRTLSVTQVLIPFFSENHPNLSELIARIGGPERIELEPHGASGWFPKTTFLEGRRPIILAALGSDVVPSEAVPAVVGEPPDERTPLIPGSSPDDLAISPRLQVLIWVWQVIGGDDEAVEAFKEACQEHHVFPTGTPDENNVVTHVAKDAETQFFFPPQTRLPDIDLSGVEFLTPAVYRPEQPVSTQEQKQLVADFRPAVEAIWDVREFQFEEVARAALLPKLPGGRSSADDTELRDRTVLEFIRQLASETIASDEPLPYTERRRNALFRLCLLPVPTRDGWERAYKVYFGTDWQLHIDPDKRVEPLFGRAEIDAPYLDESASFTDLDAVSDAEDEAETEGDSLNEWREFFQWLGVNHHVRLQSFFPPDRQRQFDATEGIERHPNSVLAELSDADWSEYRTNLIASLGDDYEDAGISNIYRVHSIEFLDELIGAAYSEEPAGEDRFSSALFNHIAGWWHDELRDFRTATLGTPGTSNYVNRRNRVFKQHEQHHVGTNLWLWRLRRTPWCPTGYGTSKPAETWLPTDELRVQFSLTDGEERQYLLPVLPAGVADRARRAAELLEALDIRRDLSRETFRPADAESVVRRLAATFDGRDQELIASYLREIKPKYRYISELLPPVQPGQQVEDVWKEHQDALEGTSVLCWGADRELTFEPAGEAFFVRSPDVRNRLPADELPVFILQEPEAVSFGRHFGLHDLERSFDPRVEIDTELVEETETIRQELQEVAPFLLCRLEAEREAQDLITEDVNGMRAFVEKLTLVDDLIVVYEPLIDDADTAEMRPNFFLDKSETGQQQRAVPILRWTDSAESRNRRIARALCDYLEVSQFEGILALLNTSERTQRFEHLRLAGAPAEPTDVQAKRQQLFVDADVQRRPGELFEGTPPAGREDDWEPTSDPAEQTAEHGSADSSPNGHAPTEPGTDPTPTVYTLEQLRFGEERVAEPIGSIQDLDWGDGDDGREGDSADDSAGTSTGGSSGGVTQGYIDEIDRRGMEITLAAERRRLEHEFGVEDPETYVYAVHTSERIEAELAADSVAAGVLRQLEDEVGIPLPYPGFDVLSVNPHTGEADRLIELKSSGLDVRKVSVTWNEWKTAMTEAVRDRFYLYVVGNLRTDGSGEPYLREICNPFSLLTSREREQTQRTREVQVNVTHFDPERGEVIEKPLIVSRAGDKT